MTFGGKTTILKLRGLTRIVWQDVNSKGTSWRKSSPQGCGLFI